MAEQQQQADAEAVQEWAGLASEVESRLRDYLGRAANEYPPGCQADWLAGAVSERLLAPSESASGGDAVAPVSLVKLSIYLMEGLADVCNAYEEFYAQQMAELREDGVAAHAQVAALEDENARLREKLHRRAEELRLAQATATELKLAAREGVSGVADKHRFDEAVDVEGDDDVVEDVEEDEADEALGDAAGAAAAVGRSSAETVCQHCGRGDNAHEAESAAAAAAVQIAALKADLADWEADMAEKVHQNVELAAQLEACQRQLARQMPRSAQSAENGSAAATTAAVPAAPRGIFSGLPLLRRKT